VRHCEEVDVVAGAAAALQIEFWMYGGQQESWISRKAVVAADDNFRMSGGAAGKFECWISRHGVVNASLWMMIWMMSGSLDQTDG
jgi:hypothetical protein